MEKLHTAPAAARRPKRREHRRGRLLIGMLAGCLLPGAAAAAPTPISAVPYVISQPGSYQITRDLTNSGVSLFAITINASNVILDGAGFTLSESTFATPVFTVGVEVLGRNVTVTRVRVTGFTDGIDLDGDTANFNNLTGNTANGNKVGIHVNGAPSNTLTGNTANGNKDVGIHVDGANSNTLTGNTTNGNANSGIHVNGASSNGLSRNIATDNGTYGIFLDGADSNTLTDNAASGNGTEDLEDLSPNCAPTTGSATSAGETSRV